MKINLKTPKEIQIMKEGGQILSQILKKLESEVKPGISTWHLEELARELVSFYKVKPSFLDYDGFPAVLCVSLNSEIVHGVPSERKLKPGDLVKLDMGVYYKSFHTDSALTVLLSGGKDEALKSKLLNVTKEALKIGINQAKESKTLGDLGSAIQNYVEAQGFNVVRELVGHGIGKELHESPQVLNYGRPGEGEKLEKGMTIAIEPMVVTGDWHIKDGEGGFVFETKDGGLAAHFEHTVAITEDRPLILTITQ